MQSQTNLNSARFSQPTNGSLSTGPPYHNNMLGGSSMPEHDSNRISIKQVTPELAAQVVKHFVLPMFDTDQKRGLRRKYGRM